MSDPFREWGTKPTRAPQRAEYMSDVTPAAAQWPDFSNARPTAPSLFSPQQPQRVAADFQPAGHGALPMATGFPPQQVIPPFALQKPQQDALALSRSLENQVIPLFRTPSRVEEDARRPADLVKPAVSGKVDVVLKEAPMPSPPTVVVQPDKRLGKESLTLLQDYLKSLLNTRIAFQSLQAMLVAELSKRIGRQLYVKGGNALSLLLSYAQNTLKLPGIDPEALELKSDWDTGLNQLGDIKTPEETLAIYNIFHQTVTEALQNAELRPFIDRDTQSVIDHVQRTLGIRLTLDNIVAVDDVGEEEWNNTRKVQVKPLEKGFFTYFTDTIDKFTLLRFMMRFRVNGTAQYANGELTDLSFSRETNIETGQPVAEYMHKNQLQTINVQYRISQDKFEISQILVMSFSDMLEDLWQMAYVEPKQAQESRQDIHPKAGKRQKRLIDFLQKVICTNTEKISLSPSASILLYPVNPFDFGACGPLRLVQGKDNLVSATPATPAQYLSMINSCPDAFIDKQFENIHNTIANPKNQKNTPSQLYIQTRAAMDECLRNKANPREREIACAFALVYYKFTVSWFANDGMWEALAFLLFHKFVSVRNDMLTRDPSTIRSLFESQVRPLINELVYTFQTENYKALNAKLFGGNKTAFTNIINGLDALSSKMEELMPGVFWVGMFGGTAFQAYLLYNLGQDMPVVTADFDVIIHVNPAASEEQRQLGQTLINVCYDMICRHMKHRIQIVESPWKNDTVGGGKRYTRQIEYISSVQYGNLVHPIVSKQHLVEFIVIPGTFPEGYLQIPGTRVHIPPPKELRQKFVDAANTNDAFDSTKRSIYMRRAYILNLKRERFPSKEEAIRILDVRTPMPPAVGSKRRTFRRSKPKATRKRKTRRRNTLRR